MIAGAGLVVGPTYIPSVLSFQLHSILSTFIYLLCAMVVTSMGFFIKWAMKKYGKRRVVPPILPSSSLLSHGEVWEEGSRPTHTPVLQYTPGAPGTTFVSAPPSYQYVPGGHNFRQC
uniref:Aa_trans domain-containing protein n=1 Tax=Strongyloides papillosus TaxID=174720 RepID=A0A0N5C6F6_STREA